jgi:hypothetical protein
MMKLTKCLSYSFVDCDMFMRHFSLDIGYLQYEHQREIRPDDHENIIVFDLDDSDCSDVSDPPTNNLNTRDLISDPEIGLDLDKKESHNVYWKGINNWGSKGNMLDIISALESNGSDCTNDSYMSF